MFKIHDYIQGLTNAVYWNIGFAEGLTPDTLHRNGKLGKIQWMRHGYKDRFFADPFILHADANKIIVLAEECIFGSKGTIVKLVIDRASKKLLERKILLQKSTHLSYPAILRHEDKVFVYPENGESGSSTLYEYNIQTDSLTPVHTLVNMPVADATIYPRISEKDKSYMLATKINEDSQGDAFLFASDKITGPYNLVHEKPVIPGRDYGRPGGGGYFVENQVVIPMQDCSRGYGRGLHLMHIESFEPFILTKFLSLRPSRRSRFHLGLHTLNFYSYPNIAVIDGYGYLHNIIGRMLGPINKLRLRLKGIR